MMRCSGCLNGAGERGVEQLSAADSACLDFWCLGGGTTMHEPGAVPETPARGIAALPLDDPLVVSMDSGTRASEARPSLLALACAAERVKRFLAAGMQDVGGRGVC